MNLPILHRLRQPHRGDTVTDVRAAVAAQLATLDVSDIAGKHIAITAGSRGIDNNALILQAAVDSLKERGARPFLVAAMGSHGGATPAGQLEILQSLGVTPASTGAEIRTCMDVVEIGQTSTECMPVRIAADALAADKILIINRVKPHTIFFGRYGSGLMKMLIIGLGKRDGAANVHAYTKEFTFDRLVESARPVYQQIAEKILGGLAIVENSEDKTGRIEAVRFDEFLHKDAELHRLAGDWMPRLPVTSADLLIVDEMGKDISGAGMDPNVIGRRQYEHHAAPDEWPKIRRIYVRSLTAASHGNAVGIGYADACSEFLVAQIDKPATYTNVITSGILSKATIPVSFRNDRDAIQSLINATVVNREPVIVRVRNTADLEHVLVSRAGLPQMASDWKNEGAVEWTFDAAGNLL